MKNCGLCVSFVSLCGYKNRKDVKRYKSAVLFQNFIWIFNMSLFNKGNKTK